MQLTLTLLVVLAVVLAGCADRPEEVSAGKFRQETGRAHRQEAAADFVARGSWHEKGGAAAPGEYGDWRLVKPVREGVLTEDDFWSFVAAYDGPKRLGVVILGPREVRTQTDLDQIQGAIDEMLKAFKAAGFERTVFQQSASFGRTILRE